MSLEKLTIEELRKLAAEQQATLKANDKTVAELTAAVTEMSAQLTDKEESLKAGKLIVTYKKEKYKILTKKIRVIKHNGEQGEIDWPKKLGKEIITAEELAKESEYLGFLINEGSGLIQAVEVKEK